MEQIHQNPYLSVVVPLYNEEENVALLVERIDEVLAGGSCTYEILLVDDGSKDRTCEIARDLCNVNKNLKVIEFRRNYGQTPAMAAGIDHAQGRVIVTMDGDLQNDPRDIPAFLNKIDEGYDLVVGWRHKRQDKLISRKIPSIIANRLIAKVTGVPIKDNGCSLKAYRADIIKNVPLYSEMHRFIPAMSSMVGIKLYEMKVRHHARQFGESKYGLSRIYKVALDLLSVRTILSSLSGPIKYFGSFAFVFLLCSLGMVVVSIFAQSFVFVSIATLLFISAMTWLFWGILCELLLSTGDSKNLDLARLSLTKIQGKGHPNV